MTEDDHDDNGFLGGLAPETRQQLLEFLGFSGIPGAQGDTIRRAMDETLALRHALRSDDSN